MNRQQIDEMTSALAGQLEERKPSGAIWRGHLSSSAISTSVAMFALYRTDSRKYASYVDAAAAWLIRSESSVHSSSVRSSAVDRK